MPYAKPALLKRKNQRDKIMPQSDPQYNYFKLTAIDARVAYDLRTMNKDSSPKKISGEIEKSPTCSAEATAAEELKKKQDKDFGESLKIIIDAFAELPSLEFTAREQYHGLAENVQQAKALTAKEAAKVVAAAPKEYELEEEPE
jgi:hypothetical protein